MNPGPAADDFDHLARVLSLVEERAPKLRKAGVLHLRLAELDLDLAPEEPELPAGFKTADDEAKGEADPTDPLDDGTTYGLIEAPGFAALRERRKRARKEE